MSDERRHETTVGRITAWAVYEELPNDDVLGYPRRNARLWTQNLDDGEVSQSIKVQLTDCDAYWAPTYAATLVEVIVLGKVAEDMAGDSEAARLASGACVEEVESDE